MHPPRSALLPACLSCAILLGCGATAENPTPTAGDVDVLPTRVQERFAGLVSAIQEQRIEQVLAYYSTDEDLVHAADGEVVRGAGTVRDAYRTNFECVADFLHVRVEPGHTTILSPTSAVHTTWFDEAFVTTEGDTLRVTGIWTTGWKRVQGEWLIVHNAASHALTDEL